ncbi:MFS transporter [Thermanaerothrix sp.]|jgi:EmrB/QacA subfamily drug resistance transporter|uniref:MFS transporter n=1 Tax=Thermanaerothrix sp. TaxID=2972675 RepID=UPI002ADD9FEA|nr:MFS transporter [Thermanaerothrix sp.]
MASSRPTSKHWLALLGVGSGVLMATLDASIVNISLPTLVKDLHTDFATVEWVVLAYVLVLTALMLGAARLGDLYNKKRLYQIGLIIFTLGSLLCGLAPTITALIVFRALQGIGAAFTQALGTAIVTEVFPPESRGRALGTIGSIVSIGIAAGPPLGGLIIAWAGWHWVFLVNLPIGIIASFIVHRVVPDLHPEKREGGFDVLGAAVLFMTMGCYALGMTMGQDLGFDTQWPRILLGIALVGLITFVIIERRQRHPMVDLTLFRNTLFSINLLMAFLVFIVMAGMFLMPFFLELVQGYPAQLVGLLMMAHPVAMGIVAPLAGALSDRYGSRGISLLGLIVVILGCLSVASIQPGLSPLGFVLHLIPFGIGLGMFQSPNNNAIMGSVPRNRLGIASGLLALMRTLGQTSGLPLMGTLFALQVRAAANLPPNFEVTQADPQALLIGLRGTYQIAAFVILIATLLAVLALWLDAQRRKQAAYSVVSGEQKTCH